jgi:hypothetical protein
VTQVAPPGGEVRVAQENVAGVVEVGVRSCRLDRDLVASQQLRGLMRVRGAADVLQERHVVDVRRVGQIELVRQRGGDHRGACRFARLEAHADVGDARQPHEQLGEPEARHAQSMPRRTCLHDH